MLTLRQIGKRRASNMSSLEQYRIKLARQLDSLSAHLKRDDINHLRKVIKEANTHSKLDAISLGLNFHKFRVENREE